MVLHLQSFSMRELGCSRLWECKDFDLELALGAQLESELTDPVHRELLHDLMEQQSSGGFVLDERQSDTAKLRALETLERECFVCKTSSSDAENDVRDVWSFTELGLYSVVVGVTLHSPTPLLAVRPDVPVRARCVFELVQLLAADGWQHVLLQRGQRRENLDPYVAGRDSTKIWYTRRDKRTISQLYLAALASAGCDTSVHHLQQDAYYECLLDGCPALPHQRTDPRFSLRAAVPDDLWDAGEVPSRPRRRRQAATAPNQTTPPADHTLERELLAEAASKSPTAADADARDDATSSGSSSSTSSADSAPNVDGVAAGVGPSSSSSSSGSSTSSSSTSTSSSSSDDDDVAAGVGPDDDADGELPAPFAVRAERAVNERIGVNFGVHRLTPRFKDSEHVGWEMTCRHAGHSLQRPCRLNRRSTGRGRTAEETLRMLQHWVVLGVLAGDGPAHQALWTEVEEALGDGSLPDVIDPGDIPGASAASAGATSRPPASRDRGRRGRGRGQERAQTRRR